MAFCFYKKLSNTYSKYLEQVGHPTEDRTLIAKIFELGILATPAL
jgi:hypothetical protein